MESGRLVGSLLGLGVQTCVRVLLAGLKIYYRYDHTNRPMERPEPLLNSLLGPGGGSGENPILEILCLQRARLNCDAAARSRALSRLVVRVLFFSSHPLHLRRRKRDPSPFLFGISQTQRRDARHARLRSHGRHAASAVQFSCSDDTARPCTALRSAALHCRK